MARDSKNFELNREYERVFNEIETTDSSFIGASLKSVYSESGHQEFLNGLSNRIKQHDKDIEKLCNFHYQGFIDSITELINVRSDAHRLKTQVESINDELQKSGKEVHIKGESLIQCRTQQKNVMSAIEKMYHCLPVLERYTILEEQMANGKFCAALKTLKRLELNYLPQIYPYRFCKIMAENVPKIRVQINEATMAELNNFLETIHKKSSWYGYAVLKQTEKKYLKELEAAAKSEELEVKSSRSIESLLDKKSPKKTRSSSRFGSTRSVRLIELSHLDFDNYVVDDKLHGTTIPVSDMIDLAALHKCMHVFDLLSCKQATVEYYRAQRKEQARLALDPPQGMANNLTSYTKYIGGIVGFFVTEDQVLNTTENLFTQQYLNSQWQMTLSKLIVHLRPESMNITESSFLLEIQHLIVVFAETMKSFGYPAEQLNDLLHVMRIQFLQVLNLQWSERFHQIFVDDNCRAIRIESREEEKQLFVEYPFFKQLLSLFQKSDKKALRKKFPKLLPCSFFVVEVHNAIMQFIMTCLEYCQDLQLNPNDIKDIVHWIEKSTNSLVTKTLDNEFQSYFAQSHIGITETVQMMVNTMYLEKTYPLIETFMQQVCHAATVKSLPQQQQDTISIKMSLAESQSVLRDVKNHAEKEMYTQFHQKIDNFFDIAEYAWDIPEAQGTASAYLLDLIGFMKNHFQAFCMLPPITAQSACLSAVQHINSSLTEILMSPDNKGITMAALHQFNLDMIHCEMFAMSEPVPGFKNEVLVHCFTELRQLLDLFLSWDWGVYFSTYGNPDSKYLRVNPGTALLLLEKLKPERKQMNIFASFSKHQRQKKKLQTSIVKQLHAIMNDWTLLCVPRRDSLTLPN